MQLLDLVDDLGGLDHAVGGRQLGLGVVGCRRHPVRCGPQRPLVDGGEERDALADRVDSGEVVGPDDQEVPRGVGIEPGPAQEVDLAPRTHELVAHVLGARHVDHAVSLALRAEDREVPSRRVAELEMHARAVPAECADDLADEAVTLGRTETGDDGQPGMKVEREGAPARLDDDSLALHQPSNRQAGRPS